MTWNARRCMWPELRCVLIEKSDKNNLIYTNLYNHWEVVEYVEKVFKTRPCGVSGWSQTCVEPRLCVSSLCLLLLSDPHPNSFFNVRVSEKPFRWPTVNQLSVEVELSTGIQFMRNTKKLPINLLTLHEHTTALNAVIEKHWVVWCLHM